MVARVLRVSLPGGGTVERKTKRAYSHAVARMVGGEWAVVSWTSSPAKALQRELAERPEGWEEWGAAALLEVEE